MKKVLSVMAVSAFVLTAGVAFAGGPGKKADASCPAPCQTQIDDLNSSQAQQNEILGAHGKQLQNHEARITALEKADYDPWFVRLGVKGTWMTQDIGPINEVDTDMGWGGAIAFGREFGALQGMGRFRAEVEVAYQDADLDMGSGNAPAALQAAFALLSQDQTVSVLTVMANGYYQIPVADAFSIYVMAGLGVAKYEIEANYFDGYTYAPGAVPGVFIASPNWGNASDSTNALAYKAGIGMTYDFTETVAGDLGFEYLGVSDGGPASSINGYNAVASVRFKF